MFFFFFLRKKLCLRKCGMKQKLRQKFGLGCVGTVFLVALLAHDKLPRYVYTLVLSSIPLFLVDFIIVNFNVEKVHRACGGWKLANLFSLIFILPLDVRNKAQIFEIDVRKYRSSGEVLKNSCPVQLESVPCSHVVFSLLIRVSIFILRT